MKIYISKRLYLITKELSKLSRERDDLKELLNYLEGLQKPLLNSKDLNRVITLCFDLVNRKRELDRIKEDKIKDEQNS